MKWRRSCFHLTRTIQYNLLSVSLKSRSDCYQDFIHIEHLSHLQIVQSAKLKTINRKIQLYCKQALHLLHHRSNTCLITMENRQWGYLCLALPLKNNFAIEVSLLLITQRCKHAQLTIVIMNFSWSGTWIRLKTWATFQNFLMTGSWALALLQHQLKRRIALSNIW